MRIYIDASVIGGYFDEEFQEWSQKLFEEFLSGKKTAIISDETLGETTLCITSVFKKTGL